MENKTKKIVLSSMLAALTCVATMIIKLPTPHGGYVNLGDCVVLLCGWLTSPIYAFASAAVGSAMADIFSGYAVYAPATFIIKGCLALCAHFVFLLLSKKLGDLPSRIISAICAEALMIGGYFVFEGFLYGFGTSLTNIPANAVQAVTGIIAGIILMKFFRKTRLFDDHKTL